METVCALYKFVELETSLVQKLQNKLLKFMQQNKIKGTILLATEGINGTISGSDEKIKSFVNYVQGTKIGELKPKYSYFDGVAFNHLKVKNKSEIVTMGVDKIDPLSLVGVYIDPDKWNDLITDENTIVIDTRNDYEFKIGHFKNALNPNTKNFRQFVTWYLENKEMLKGKNLALYCTGGIRCEKATSLLLAHGEENVFHLNGGILAYIEQIAKEESLWLGECFVFDNRVSVDHDLKPGKYDMCFACKNPITDEDKKSEKFASGISCPLCFDITSDEKKASFTQRQYQIELAKKRGQKHLSAQH